ncbi:hypothetical protein B0H12DRAFT_1329321 [Mycena haematopus]|nr:hypothetical protein B0H12DRAFT_1329321 [Mycena haematopus]
MRQTHQPRHRRHLPVHRHNRSARSSKSHPHSPSASPVSALNETLPRIHHPLRPPIPASRFPRVTLRFAPPHSPSAPRDHSTSPRLASPEDVRGPQPAPSTNASPGLAGRRPQPTSSPTTRDTRRLRTPHPVTRVRRRSLVSPRFAGGHSQSAPTTNASPRRRTPATRTIVGRDAATRAIGERARRRKTRTRREGEGSKVRSHLPSALSDFIFPFLHSSLSFISTCFFLCFFLSYLQQPPTPRIRVPTAPRLRSPNETNDAPLLGDDTKPNLSPHPARRTNARDRRRDEDGRTSARDAHYTRHDAVTHDAVTQRIRTRIAFRRRGFVSVFFGLSSFLFVTPTRCPHDASNAETHPRDAFTKLRTRSTMPPATGTQRTRDEGKQVEGEESSRGDGRVRRDGKAPRETRRYSGARSFASGTFGRRATRLVRARASTQDAVDAVLHARFLRSPRSSRITSTRSLTARPPTSNPPFASSRTTARIVRIADVGIATRSLTALYDRARRPPHIQLPVPLVQAPIADDYATSSASPRACSRRCAPVLRSHVQRPPTSSRPTPPPSSRRPRAGGLRATRTTERRHGQLKRNPEHASKTSPRSRRTKLAARVSALREEIGWPISLRASAHIRAPVSPSGVRCAVGLKDGGAGDTHPGE